MLKKILIALALVQLGELIGYVRTNAEARARALDAGHPPIVLPPSKPQHYLWVDLTNDPSEPRSIKRNF
jgi:hypothetical protein